jgi:hypothetical protein
MQVEEHRGHRPVVVRGSRGWSLSPGREEGRRFGKKRNNTLATLQ